MSRRTAAALFLALTIAGPTFAAAATQDLREAFAQRRLELLKSFQPQLFESSDVKARSYDVIASAASNQCGQRDLGAEMVHALDPSVQAKSPDSATKVFVLPPLTRFILQFGSCLASEEERAVKDRLSAPQPLFDHGTQNHAIMSATSYYLLAQHYPDLKWQDPKGLPLSSAQIMTKYKSLLLGRFKQYMQEGFNEQLSPTYAPIDLFPLLNLIDFAQDKELAEAAQQMAVAEIAILRVDSLDGALLPPLARENPPGQERTNPDSVARDLLWLYYGGFGPLPTHRPEPPYGAMLAASTWQPPLELLALNPLSHGPYDVQTTTPSFGTWGQPTRTELVGGAHIEPDFAIGAGDEHPDPAWYNDHTVAFRILIRGLKPVGAIDCYQPYWHGDEGEDAWDTDRSSPFQHVETHGRWGILSYDIPDSDPYRFSLSNKFFREREHTADHLHHLAECRLPRAANNMIRTPNGTFAQYGDVQVGFISDPGPIEYDPRSGGSTLKDFVTIKIRGSHLVLFYEVRSAEGETLTAFSQEMKRQDVVRMRAFSGITKPENGGTAFGGAVINSKDFLWAAGRIDFH